MSAGFVCRASKPYRARVATFPPIGDIERDSALDRIARRHLRHDDYRWSEAGTDARDVLNYLRAHRSRLPPRLLADDAWDELVLSAWVYWDERRRERELLRSALARGLSFREVGAFVGLYTGQGLRDYLDSLEARLHEYHRITRESRAGENREPAGRELLTADVEQGPARDTAETDPYDSTELHVARRSRNPYLRHKGRPRAVRGADGRFARDRRVAAGARPARQAWIEHHDRRIRDVLDQLLAEAERAGFQARGDDDVEEASLEDYLEWIREDLEAGSGVDDGTFGSLGLALGVLRSEPAVIKRAPNHGIRRAIAAADRLRADYAALTPTRATT